jgi:hypothetical protein
MGSTDVGRFEQHRSEVWAGAGLAHGGCFGAACQLPGVVPLVERGSHFRNGPPMAAAK